MRSGSRASLACGALCVAHASLYASSELTLRQTRRLLETDLQLPLNALDEEPHKSLIKHQVDEACRVSCSYLPTALTRARADNRSCDCSWSSKPSRTAVRLL